MQDVPQNEPPCRFDTILCRILGGEYSTYLAFERDVLAAYGKQHRNILARLHRQHSDLIGKEHQEEVLGDFIKII